MAITYQDEYFSDERSANITEQDAELFPSYGPIHAYLWWSRQVSHAPLIFHLGGILPGLCAELARRRWRIDPEQKLIPSTWSVLVGGPASGKSTGMTLARDFCTMWAAGTGEARIDPWLLAEGTPEGLVEVLAKRFDPAHAETYGTLCHEELSTLLSHKQRIIEYLCYLAEHKTLSRSLRKYQEQREETGDAPDTVNAPRLSACFCITQIMLRKSFDIEHIAGGLASRLQWFYATLSAEERNFGFSLREKARETALGVWHDWLADLRGFEIRLTSEGRPRVVEFSSEAEELFRQHWEYWNRRIHDEDAVGASIQRSFSWTRVIAGVYALSRSSTLVDLRDMRSAIALSQRSLAGIYHVEQHVGVSEDYAASRRLLARVASSGPDGIARKELAKLSKLGSGAFQAALQTLLDNGEAEAFSHPSGKRGRPPIFIRTGRVESITTPIADDVIEGGGEGDGRARLARTRVVEFTSDGDSEQPSNIVQLFPADGE